MTAEEYKSNLIKEHLKASRELTKELVASPAKARAFLIRAGILNKAGTKPANRSEG